MDHQEALRLQAEEKYVLGELTPELREQFEEHYFDCPECAAGLKALGTFVTASRLVFKGAGTRPRVPSHSTGVEKWSWLHWLRPAIAAPAIALLVAIIVFQNIVTIPSTKKPAGAENVAPVYESSYRLAGATRGGNVSTIRVRPGESFALDFDFTPARAFPSYQGKLFDSAGRTVLTFGIRGEQGNKELHLVVPGGKVHSGNYEVVVSGENGNSDQGSKNSEVLRIPFVVASEP